MFGVLFSNVGMMLFYMLIGFVLCKSHMAQVSHAKSMSALLLYVLNPAMLINSFLQLEYSVEAMTQIGKYFITSLVIQLLFFGVLYFVFKRRHEDARFRILTVGGVLGNVGYMGLPIVCMVFPNNPIVMAYSSINVMSMNLIVFTLGVFMITNDKKFVSIKSAIVNPTTLAILCAIPLFLLRIKFPDPIQNSVTLMGKMVTPMCMFILGMRLSAADLKAVFTRGFVYLTCLFKLVAFPLFAFWCVHWIPFLDDVLKSCIVILAAVPSGAVIENLAELHECEQELAANVVLLTTILSVLSIPIMTTILI